jgi:hypothetical protein
MKNGKSYPGTAVWCIGVDKMREKKMKNHIKYPWYVVDKMRKHMSRQAIPII